MDAVRETPIYLKAQEIQRLVFSVIDLVKESELPDAREIELSLLEDDLVNMKSLTAEIVAGVVNGSTTSFPYDLRMENAVLIKKAARDLQAYAYGIEDMGLKDIDYLDLIHEEIDAFRILFIDWVNNFDLWKYDDDDWGLFTPEGIKIIDTGYNDITDDMDQDDEYYDEEDDDEEDDDDI